MKADVIVVGGGIIGLSTGYEILKKYPSASVILLEKEGKLAEHQTGRNSGVVHSGIYYKPGSFKAGLCRKGKTLLQQYCEESGVAFDTCGKVIVAVTDDERAALNNIFERGKANGVACKKIGVERLKELEPHVTGVEAIEVSETGIVDYVGFCESLGSKMREGGHEIRLGHKVTQVKETTSGIVVETDKGSVEGSYLVNCAGLYSDKVVEMAGLKPSAKIVPFRGEYFELVPDAYHLCKNLIYPVPDPSFPFLGVHFTRMILGGVECGPNAVLAFAREGYGKTTVNLPELFETLGYVGFRKLAGKFWKTGMGEMWRSASKGAFVKALQRLVPEIESKHIHAAPAGVRAQAIGPDGKTIDDFDFTETDRAVHVVNAPSPAATASLAIGEMIVEKLSTRFDKRFEQPAA